MVYLSKSRLLLVFHGLLQGELPLERLLLLHLVVVELGEVVHDDGDGQGHHKHSRYGAASADKHTRTWTRNHQHFSKQVEITDFISNAHLCDAWNMPTAGMVL